VHVTSDPQQLSDQRGHDVLREWVEKEYPYVRELARSATSITST